MRTLLFALLFFSCNPVKQVLNDKNKFEQVAKEVIKQGYCANDTIYSVTSDTIVQESILIDTMLEVKVFNDTVFVFKNIEKIKNKYLTIHDTIKSVVIDNALVKVLEAEIGSLNSDKVKLQDSLLSSNRASNIRLLIIIGICAILLLIKFK